MLMKTIIALSALLLLFACAPEREDLSIKKAIGGAKYGGEFRFMSPEKVESLIPIQAVDIYTQRITSQIFDQLLVLDPSSQKIVPGLAVAHSVSKNGLVYTFQIRKGVRFHPDDCFENETRELDANDIKFTLDMACSGLKINKVSWLLVDRVKGAKDFYNQSKNTLPEKGVSGIKVVNKNTLEITLNEPLASFEKILSYSGFGVFPKEAFDKLYPGYGSSYINFYGGAGFLFEQGSSRGHVQETTTIPITFAFTIRNQFTASLATIKASLAEKDALLDLRKNFYETAKKQVEASVIKGYAFGDPNDYNRTKAFVDLLQIHRVDVYEVPNSKQFYVPVAQDNHIMVRTIFENQIPYKDSSFYDASTWSLIHAFNLPYTEVKTAFVPGAKINAALNANKPAATKSTYAYIVNNTDYNIHKFIFDLQKQGVIVQTATRPFSITIGSSDKQFGYGTVVVSVQQQQLSSDKVFEIIQAASKDANIEVHSIGSGFSNSGIDLGSNYVRTLKKPEAIMIIGTGVAAPEAGEVWHLLDQRLSMPITKADVLTFSRIDLTRYNTMIMVSGNYALLDKSSVDKIRAWIQNGNTLITIKGGAEWAIRNGITKHKLITDSVFSSTRQLYDRAVEIEGAKALGGSIFKIDLDTTHLVGYGFTNKYVSVYKNGLTFFQKSSNPYNTVAQYLNEPVVGGYVHATTLKKMRNNPSILIGQEGMGRVVLFADEPNFRGAWYGTNKLFLNALFYGSLINVPSVVANELAEDAHE